MTGWMMIVEGRIDESHVLIESIGLGGRLIVDIYWRKRGRAGGRESLKEGHYIV